MAIEKMIMLNIVGHITDIDKVSKSLVLSGCVQPVDAMQELNTTDFTVKTTEDNLEALLDVCYIRPYTSSRNLSELEKAMEKIRNICPKGWSNKIKAEELIDDYSSLRASIMNLEEILEKKYEVLQNKVQEKEKLLETLKYLQFLKNVDITFEELNNLKYMDCRLMKISSENMQKLKDNYENIPSIAISIYEQKDYRIIMALTPYLLLPEAVRIYNSLNCEIIPLSVKEKGTPKEVIQALNSRLNEINIEIKQLELELNKQINDNKRQILILEKSLELEVKSSIIKDHMACTNEFFYFSGWVPKSLLGKVKKSIEYCEDRLIITEKEAHEVSSDIVVPTSMKNNFIVRPFESMVHMYAVPSYGELDPTLFLGLSYMLLFGAMFGDVGQGLVFILAGIFLVKKMRRPNLGGVIFRLGISSTIFGFAYGSIFGFEEFPEFIHEAFGIEEMPHFFIRPMDNIMETLIFGVILGCILLIISYIFSLINHFKKKDLENGVFGKEGLVGFIFFLSLLGFVVTTYFKINLLPNGVWFAIFGVSLLLMLIKEPLANLILGKRPLYSEGKSDYYVEGGFGIIETLISMFSNTVSFIRVGAFALNHVGLFMAFTALANMMNGAGSVFMYILGNVVILGLEGLIVFIQGLRLEYYELFSKYYEGEGEVFESVKLIGVL
ncbi:MAG: hypothetical protein GX895_02130 [Clostridiales bacterium]|nr:hypothetical protein [Clostridiales bacterium]